jgi:UDP:flavonoid glycosyltransferase YjiC (YdhE family)
MKILLASTPATGHLNPLLAIGRILIGAGHQVVGLSGNAFRDRIESIGAAFRSLPPGADFDLRDVGSVGRHRGKNATNLLLLAHVSRIWGRTMPIPRKQCVKWRRYQ